MRRALLVVTVAFALAATGCEQYVPPKPPASYAVQAHHSESVSEKLDARWFTRDIEDDHGLLAIELVYCPIVPNDPTVCRTAVVWERGKTLLGP